MTGNPVLQDAHYHDIVPRLGRLLDILVPTPDRYDRGDFMWSTEFEVVGRGFEFPRLGFPRGKRYIGVGGGLQVCRLLSLRRVRLQFNIYSTPLSIASWPPGTPPTRSCSRSTPVHDAFHVGIFTNASLPSRLLIRRSSNFGDGDLYLSDAIYGRAFRFVT